MKNILKIYSHKEISFHLVLSDICFSSWYNYINFIPWAQLRDVSFLSITDSWSCFHILKLKKCTSWKYRDEMKVASYTVGSKNITKAIRKVSLTWFDTFRLLEDLLVDGGVLLSQDIHQRVLCVAVRNWITAF